LNKYVKFNFGDYRCGTSSIVDVRCLKVNFVGTVMVTIPKKKDAEYTENIYIHFISTIPAPTPPHYADS